MTLVRFTLRFEEPAATVLRACPPELQAALVAVLAELEVDPYIKVGGINWRESKGFVMLQKQGYPIRIMKAREIQGWRVFFFLAQKQRVVLVKEIVRRESDAVTYGTAPHVQRLIDNYEQFRLGKKGK
jgi:hypothetical protein